MFRTISLLIVMVLATAPATSLACELWCTMPDAEDHHLVVGCDDPSRSPSQGQHVSALAVCHTAEAITPFVTEVRPTDATPLAALTTVLPTGSFVPYVDAAAALWLVCNIPPPVGLSLRSVLRI
jgi:hypothetical protein